MKRLRKNIEKQLMVAIDFHIMEKDTMEVDGYVRYLVFKIYFVFSWKKFIQVGGRGVCVLDWNYIQYFIETCNYHPYHTTVSRYCC